jgi:hypothetical protein
MNVRDSNFFILVVNLSVLFTLCTCVSGQKKLVSKEEVSVKFQHVGKLGSTSVYAVERTKIPNAPKLPNSYEPLGDKGYLISTDTIDLGHPTAFFKAPVTTVEKFEKVSVLRLAVNEISPYGYEWQDCTTSLEVVRGQRHPKMLEERKDFDDWYRAGMEKLLPDLATKTITCRPDDKWKNDEYFILATRTAAPPSQPFTNLRFTLLNENRPDAKELTYRVSIKNTGPLDIASLSIFSRFDIDAKVKKVAATQGACAPPPSDTSGGITICHLGRLPKEAEVTVEFVGSDSGMPATIERGAALNFGWDINAFFVKHLGDPLWWGANRVNYRPLADLQPR